MVPQCSVDEAAHRQVGPHVRKRSRRVLVNIDPMAGVLAVGLHHRDAAGRGAVRILSEVLYQGPDGIKGLTAAAAKG